MALKWQKSKSVIPAVVAVVCAGSFLLSRADAQGAPVSLQEQLAAQYKLVKMGSDSGGPSVITAGTLLAVQKGGILGVAYSESNVPHSQQRSDQGDRSRYGEIWEDANYASVSGWGQGLSVENRG